MRSTSPSMPATARPTTTTGGCSASRSPPRPAAPASTFPSTGGSSRAACAGAALPTRRAHEVAGQPAAGAHRVPLRYHQAGPGPARRQRMPEPADGLNVKISDDELRGRYSNLLRIAHTREEFILDFINLLPPQGIVSARILTSPGHLKRIIRALSANLERYEQTFGPIQEAEEPVAEGSVH